MYTNPRSNASFPLSAFSDRRCQHDSRIYGHKSTCYCYFRYFSGV